MSNTLRNSVRIGRLAQLLGVVNVLLASFFVGPYWYNVIAELCFFVMCGGIIAMIEIVIQDVQSRITERSKTL